MSEDTNWEFSLMPDTIEVTESEKQEKPVLMPPGLPTIIRGAKKIAKFRDCGVSTIYHELEAKDAEGNPAPKIPGAVKRNNRWELNVAVYLREVFGEGAAA